MDIELVGTEELTPEREAEMLVALHEEEQPDPEEAHLTRWGNNLQATKEIIRRKETLRKMALDQASSVQIELSHELDETAPPPMLIEGWLPGAYEDGSGAVNVLYGPPGSGKTFCAMDMALALGSGRPWQDTYAVHPGEDTNGVVWIAMESAAAVRWRHKAWCEANGVHKNFVDFALVRGFAGLYDAKGKLPRNIEGLYFRLEEMDFKPSLIVVDTLQAAMAGLDENSVEDMGAVMRSLREMSDALSCATLLIHHTGKSDNGRERGSSYLRGATDGMLYVSNGTLSVSRFKEAAFDKDIKLPFTLETVGDSAVFRVTPGHFPDENPAREAPEAESREPTPGTLRHAILALVCEAGDEGIAPATVITALGDVKPSHVSAMATKLVKSGHIRREGATRNVRYYAL